MKVTSVSGRPLSLLVAATAILGISAASLRAAPAELPSLPAPIDRALERDSLVLPERDAAGELAPPRPAQTANTVRQPIEEAGPGSVTTSSSETSPVGASAPTPALAPLGGLVAPSRWSEPVEGTTPSGAASAAERAPLIRKPWAR